MPGHNAYGPAFIIGAYFLRQNKANLLFHLLFTKRGIASIRAFLLYETAALFGKIHTVKEASTKSLR